MVKRFDDMSDLEKQVTIDWLTSHFLESLVKDKLIDRSDWSLYFPRAAGMIYEFIKKVIR